jgi:hypothetical protein
LVFGVAKSVESISAEASKEYARPSPGFFPFFSPTMAEIVENETDCVELQPESGRALHSALDYARREIATEFTMSA